ncbi:MAG: 4Fe-4S binding protein [Clostridia bacterium]|nr:4Fe-4S binding protein [Clostridia bacterium]
MKRLNLSGNEAVAQAALAAGVKLITGYPGTPSSEVVDSLWGRAPAGVTVEWSVNEKVALDTAGACAWAGQRALCTMKMSGLNVAYDSLISFAYSGCSGGLVVYVCDDPGVESGMPEQDVRGFAHMSDLPVLEPASVAESYWLTGYAFELSEKIGGPVLLRSVTNVSQSHAVIEIAGDSPPPQREAVLIRDIKKYTKGGAEICLAQHRDLLARLDAAGRIMHADSLHQLELGERGKPGIISVGVANAFVPEALSLLREEGIDTAGFSRLSCRATIPAPREEIAAMLEHCSSVVVLEENEPYLERAVIEIAYRLRLADKRIAGKLDGLLSRIGAYDAAICARGIAALLGCSYQPQTLAAFEAEAYCCERPIGVCAGCPHRGVYIALNQAVKKLGYHKDEVMVTGDIGCTILGMSPPFQVLWTEVSMGASVAMAQGYVHAGVKTPVFSTMGDSTFLHAGMPPLLNAVQNQTPITAIIMDNGWTAMTGMQVNANTAAQFQQSALKKRVDLADIVRGLGVEQLWIADPYDLPALTAILVEAARLPGVKVVITRRECAIQAGRRKLRYGRQHIDQELCIKCKRCITTTGCPALFWDGELVGIDESQCNGCGVCSSICPKSAIVREGE